MTDRRTATKRGFRDRLDVRIGRDLTTAVPLQQAIGEMIAAPNTR